MVIWWSTGHLCYNWPCQCLQLYTQVIIYLHYMSLIRFLLLYWQMVSKSRFLLSRFIWTEHGVWIAVILCVTLHVLFIIIIMLNYKQFCGKLTWAFFGLFFVKLDFSIYFFIFCYGFLLEFATTQNSLLLLFLINCMPPGYVATHKEDI